jgi:hypothetical protein
MPRFGDKDTFLAWWNERPSHPSEDVSLLRELAQDNSEEWATPEWAVRFLIDEGIADAQEAVDILAPSLIEIEEEIDRLDKRKKAMRDAMYHVLYETNNDKGIEFAGYTFAVQQGSSREVESYDTKAMNKFVEWLMQQGRGDVANMVLDAKKVEVKERAGYLKVSKPKSKSKLQNAGDGHCTASTDNDAYYRYFHALPNHEKAQELNRHTGGNPTELSRFANEYARWLGCNRQELWVALRSILIEEQSRRADAIVAAHGGPITEGRIDEAIVQLAA